MPTFDEKLPTDELLSQVRAAAQWGAQYGVAMVYHPRIDFYSYEGEQAIPTRPEEIPSKIALINEMLAVTADHPNTLGYWTFDEPENALYKAYGQWEQRKDVGLAQWIGEGMRWTYEAFKTGDPDAYVMPTIACGPTRLAPLYDVNVPSTYQGGEEIYQVVYDCMRRRCHPRDRRSLLIFMPAIYDTPAGIGTRARDALLIHRAFTRERWVSWLAAGPRLMEYRRAVIYPVMREVNRPSRGCWARARTRDQRYDTATATTCGATGACACPRRGGRRDRARRGGAPGCLPARAARITWLLIAVNRREPNRTFYARHHQPARKALTSSTGARLILRTGRLPSSSNPSACAPGASCPTDRRGEPHDGFARQPGGGGDGIMPGAGGDPGACGVAVAG